VPYLLFDNGLFGHKNYLFLFFDQKDKPTKHVASSKQIYTQFSVFVGANIWHNFKSPESRAMYPVLCRFSAQNMTIEGATRHEIQHWNLEVTFFYHCACFSTY
jgi:hypothetical protein